MALLDQLLAAVRPWVSLLTLSLALNLLLLIVLFFRSALNKIVENAYSEWRTRMATRRQLLTDVYAQVDAIGRDHFLVLATTGMIWNAHTDEERGTFMAKLEEMTPRVAEAQSFLTRHELELPHEIRALVDQLRSRMMLPSIEAAGNARSIAESSSAVNRLVQDIQTAISRQLK